MIQVMYNRQCNRLTVDGHAGAAPKGEDLVCSAASILALTLGENVKHLAFIQAAVDIVAEITDGKATISCVAVPGCEKFVAEIFQAVVVGFEILANQFPDNISFKICGEWV